jgi:hypothetical protein
MIDDPQLKGKLRYEKGTETYISLEPPAAHKGALEFGWVISYALYRGYVNSKDMVLFHARLDNGVALNIYRE